MSTAPDSSRAPSPPQDHAQLERRIGLFDAAMLVIGGIVGAGIFRNPYEVAKIIPSPLLILMAWFLGGMLALAGAFVYAELTASRPAIGGQYAFFKEAFHPAVAFMYGWGLLLVVQTGGMAAVSITFADYFLKFLTLIGAGALSQTLQNAGSFLGSGGGGKLVALIALAGLTLINCAGVRAGALVQTILTVLKMLAIAGIVACGLFATPSVDALKAAAAVTGVSYSLGSFGAAMVPVLFAYGGWQTACFIAGEVKNPRRNLPLGLLLGVFGVLVLYLSINWVCLRFFGAAGLAQTKTPAADLVQTVLGDRGSLLLTAGVVISTFGFLSQGMLTAPRVYFAMADDRIFFRGLARIHPVTKVPTAAIALQGVMAMIIALSGQYAAILNYVVSVDFIFYGLTATCVFIFRARDRRDPSAPTTASHFRIPFHPYTTLFFIAGCWLVVASSIYAEPAKSLIGIGVLAAGIPIYLFWQRRETNP